MGFASHTPVATVTSVDSSTGVQTLLGENPNRRGLTIYNDSTATLYVKLGAGASSSDFTVKLFQDDYYEQAYTFTGQVTGVWATANGSAKVTEIS